MQDKTPPESGPAQIDRQPKGEFICVNCGFMMTQRQCKVRCERCGYFEDCSDGGNDPTNYV